MTVSLQPTAHGLLNGHDHQSSVHECAKMSSRRRVLVESAWDINETYSGFPLIRRVKTGFGQTVVALDKADDAAAFPAFYGKGMRSERALRQLKVVDDRRGGRCGNNEEGGD